jgi:hypothetical protein
LEAAAADAPRGGDSEAPSGSSAPVEDDADTAITTTPSDIVSTAANDNDPAEDPQSEVDEEVEPAAPSVQPLVPEPTNDNAPPPEALAI